MEPWDDVWRRNQFLCSAFAARFPDRKILFVSPPLDVSNHLRHGRLRALRPQPAAAPRDYPNISITRAIKLFPNTLHVGRLLNQMLERRHVANAARLLEMRGPALLWLNPHYAVHMVGRMDECAVIYDITDDWTRITQTKSTTRLTIEQDAFLCRRADAVIVCSQRLYELKKDMARNVHLIPNGVDFEHYRSIPDRGGPVAPASAQWKRPVLGYTGTIHPDRVDIDLIYEIASRMPEASVVLVGPNHLSSRSAQLLRSAPNIFLIDAVPYCNIPQYMRAFDVCITPHLVTPFTESLNPIKLWEYLASGKPIVSTNVAGFRDFPHLVSIAGSAEEFVAAVRRAACETEGMGALRQREAMLHSWQNRLDSVVSVMEPLCRK